MTPSAAADIERAIALLRLHKTATDVEKCLYRALERVAHLERIARLAAEGSPKLPIALAEFQRCASGAGSPERAWIASASAHSAPRR